MATLARGGRITVDDVDRETARLRDAWSTPATDGCDVLGELLTPDQLQEIDLYDRLQLAAVIEVCRRSRTLSDAGRALFAVSRSARKQANDADRLRKLLVRHGLTWSDVKAPGA